MFQSIYLKLCQQSTILCWLVKLISPIKNKFATAIAFHASFSSSRPIMRMIFDEVVSSLPPPQKGHNNRQTAVITRKLAWLISPRFNLIKHIICNKRHITIIRQLGSRQTYNLILAPRDACCSQPFSRQRIKGGLRSLVSDRSFYPHKRYSNEWSWFCWMTWMRLCVLHYGGPNYKTMMKIQSPIPVLSSLSSMGKGERIDKGD